MSQLLNESNIDALANFVSLPIERRIAEIIPDTELSVFAWIGLANVWTTYVPRELIDHHPKKELIRTAINLSNRLSELAIFPSISRGNKVIKKKPEVKRRSTPNKSDFLKRTTEEINRSARETSDLLKTDGATDKVMDWKGSRIKADDYLLSIAYLTVQIVEVLTEDVWTPNAKLEGFASHAEKSIRAIAYSIAANRLSLGEKEVGSTKDEENFLTFHSSQLRDRFGGKVGRAVPHKTLVLLRQQLDIKRRNESAVLKRCEPTGLRQLSDLHYYSYIAIGFLVLSTALVDVKVFACALILLVGSVIGVQLIQLRARTKFIWRKVLICTSGVTFFLECIYLAWRLWYGE